MTKLIAYRKWKNKNVLSMKRARVQVELHWKTQKKKEEKKKVYFAYVWTAGRNRSRQENIYGDREETFFKEK